MMYVMATNVRGEPTHNRTRSHVAGGFQRRLLIRPTRLVVKRDARKIVLRIKEIRPDRESDETRNGLREHQRLPAAELK